MRRELFIVARDRSDLYRYLSQTFADAENVEVIWDRRTTERRQGDTTASPERRRRPEPVPPPVRVPGPPSETQGS